MHYYLVKYAALVQASHALRVIHVLWCRVSTTMMRWAPGSSGSCLFNNRVLRLPAIVLLNPTFRRQRTLLLNVKPAWCLWKLLFVVCFIVILLGKPKQTEVGLPFFIFFIFFLLLFSLFLSLDHSTKETKSFLNHHQKYIRSSYVLLLPWISQLLTFCRGHVCIHNHSSFHGNDNHEYWRSENLCFLGQLWTLRK